MPAMPRVIVMGGSLGGLTAALVLRDTGCDVRVFERSSSALQARGAGIAALDATLRYLVERGGYRPGGRLLVHRLDPLLQPRRQPAARAAAPLLVLVVEHDLPVAAAAVRAGRYLLGHEVVAFAQDGDTVSVTLADGSRAEADLLVCADGVSSTARAD